VGFSAEGFARRSVALLCLEVGAYLIRLVPFRITCLTSWHGKKRAIAWLD